MLNNPITVPTDLHFLTISKAARLIGQRLLSPVEGSGRVAQPFGFRPHRSGRAAFQHPALPEKTRVILDHDPGQVRDSLIQ